MTIYIKISCIRVGTGGKTHQRIHELKCNVRQIEKTTRLIQYVYLPSFIYHFMQIFMSGGQLQQHILLTLCEWATRTIQTQVSA